MNFFAHFPPTRVWYGACRAPAIIMKSTGIRGGPPELLFINGTSATAGSRQLLRSFHNKSLPDKDSLAPTVYDPLTMIIPSGDHLIDTATTRHDNTPSSARWLIQLRLEDGRLPRGQVTDLRERPGDGQAWCDGCGIRGTRQCDRPLPKSR